MSLCFPYLQLAQKDGVVVTPCSRAVRTCNTGQVGQPAASSCFQNALLPLLASFCAAAESELELLDRILCSGFCVHLTFFHSDSGDKGLGVWIKQLLYLLLLLVLMGQVRSPAQALSCSEQTTISAQLILEISEIICYPVRPVGFFETTWSRCKS